MIVWKDIKPQRLKDKRIRMVFLNAMRKEGTQIKHDFQRTTKTWEHKPKFEVEVSLSGPGPVVMVGTDDKIYGYVNEGTKPHLIMAGIYTGKSKKKVLAFPEGYTAKTVPGVLDAKDGGPHGDVILRPYVHHPGTEARRFDEEIQKLWEKRFKRDMEEVLGEVAKESGHAL